MMFLFLFFKQIRGIKEKVGTKIWVRTNISLSLPGHDLELPLSCRPLITVSVFTWLPLPASHHYPLFFFFKSMNQFLDRCPDVSPPTCHVVSSVTVCTSRSILLTAFLHSGSSIVLDWTFNLENFPYVWLYQLMIIIMWTQPRAMLFLGVHDSTVSCPLVTESLIEPKTSRTSCTHEGLVIQVFLPELRAKKHTWNEFFAWCSMMIQQEKEKKIFVDSGCSCLRLKVFSFLCDNRNSPTTHKHTYTRSGLFES